jgi:predicted ArsR family transcriptional regulator
MPSDGDHTRDRELDLDGRIAGVASLAEPQRRALYRFIVDRGTAVTKDEAAAALGVARSVAAFHLDRLVADGLLATEFRRLTGRQGPGAGRPAKLYRRADGEVAVSLPPRRYDLAAQLLAAAVDDATATGRPVGEALTEVATARGRELGERVQDEAGRPRGGRRRVDVAVAALADEGYEPRPQDGEVVLANCPFHALVDERRDLVCGMNRDLLSGYAGTVGDGLLTARLAPSEGNCCVRLVRRTARSR